MLNFFKRSLLWKYVVLILIAIVLLPISFPVITMLMYQPWQSRPAADESLYPNGVILANMWKSEADALAGSSEEKIAARLAELKEKYKEATMLYVNRDGRTALKLPESAEAPELWTPQYTAAFMKRSYGGDPFTAVALLSDGEGSESGEDGFIVFQVPRSVIVKPDGPSAAASQYAITATLAVLALFLLMSVLFFIRVRRRLVRLQHAMLFPSAGEPPQPVQVKSTDEIGMLERSFNDMIEQLERSRRREKEEESLRKQLIANLSHDLRTPLTAIQGHAHRLRNEPLTSAGKQSVELIHGKVDYLGRLIDNLFSYTLLSTGKYPYRPQRTDIVRLVRNICSGWYPAFEREHFDIEIDLPDASLYWDVDPQWLERVLDNFLQNVMRHAKEGKFVGVRVAESDGRALIMLRDKGPGMNGGSREKGAGIGLSISALMLKEMNVEWDMHSTGQGTEIVLSKGLGYL
ncbi:sensor histidine kinase [Paenibacillus thermotolerans]|uniref:sensor histidine kinase n=1 Tax=Paenibacillus thermotolerans TaxID=3027807 RepID=UPI0023687F84|nr:MULTISPECIES: HAMP domain-containing sensor histidine kinase [unclassified Paenibacillus]